MTADWQHGYDLETLKALAAPFKERHKKLVFGAFGLTKERDIAEAMSESRLIWTGKPPRAVAIVKQLKRPSEQQDFAQRQFVIPAGVVMVKAFAAMDAESGNKILAALRERAGADAPFAAEIFEEDEIARECVAAAKLVYIGTRISAGSEVKGIYSSAAGWLGPLPREDEPALEIIGPDFLGTKELAAVRAELAAFGDHFAQHYSDYNKRKSWTAFGLRGYSDDPTFIIKQAEMSKGWKEEHPDALKEKARWTPAAKQFPRTLEAVKRLGVEYDRVRFMRLRAKDGELSRHADITDREAGTADGFLSRLHIPILTSDAVTFYGWTARGEKIERKLPAGALCYLDQRKPHAVTNTDPALDRVHLVLDCYANDKLRAMIARPFPKAAAA